MSDGEDAPTDSEPASEQADAGKNGTPGEGDISDDKSVDTTDLAITASPEELEEQLNDAEDSVESADTEDDLDGVETTLDAIESGIETLAEAGQVADADSDESESASEDEDETAQDETISVETVRSHLEDVRELVDEARGPYDTDVAALYERVAGVISETRWTSVGIAEIKDSVETFTSEVRNLIDVTVEIRGEEPDDFTATLESAADAVTGAGLDPDENADAIADLLNVGETLETTVEDAEDWSDLETNEQLRAEGFYDVLGHYKDFPPELAALKRHERSDNPDMVLLALTSLQSEFMQGHCLDAFQRMGRRAATEDVLDELLGRAEKRDEPAIEALGKMRAPEAIAPFLEFIDEDSNPQLQKVTFRALGEIGTQEAVQPLAQKLTLDNEHVQPIAARALGMIGDTRAIAPLAETLQTDESQEVRTAAAWALRQIGTRAALEPVADQTTAEEFTVRHEAELAAEALDAAPQSV